VEGDAHAAYKRMEAYYTSDENMMALEMRYETKLNKLKWEHNYPGGPTKFMSDFQQCVLDLEIAQQQPMSNNQKKSKFCNAILDPVYLNLRDIIMTNPALDYDQSITMAERHVAATATSRTSSRRFQNARRQGRGRDGRAGHRGGGRGRGGRNGRGRGRGVNYDEWISDERWRVMSKADRAQTIVDRLRRSEGSDTRSMAVSTVQPAQEQQFQAPTSVLTYPQTTLPPGSQTGTSNSVISNMMSPQYANPNRTVNAMKTIRINSGVMYDG
ncbi:MAG: hypothetical protein ACREOZ_01815, partial [Gloeomargaritales cyanobacterium]